MVSRRTQRVAEQLKSEIARMLLEEVTDPRIELVTLTRVDVAPDLSHALVFWSSLDATTRDRIEEGLESAASFLRRRLARQLSLKRMPELRFCYDPSLALGSRTLALLRSLSDDEPA
ncbi:MAG: 30S ribosome-binding factor RbfA [Myxococcales bacterium]|nr:30S ribosome-binding factor RbfA [Myxococcales bacterium]